VIGFQALIWHVGLAKKLHLLQYVSRQFGSNCSKETSYNIQASSREFVCVL
jgi:hypothetical protein